MVSNGSQLAEGMIIQDVAGAIALAYALIIILILAFLAVKVIKNNKEK